MDLNKPNKDIVEFVTFILGAVLLFLIIGICIDIYKSETETNTKPQTELVHEYNWFLFL